MKLFSVCCLLFLLSSTAHSQSYTNSFKNDICGCLESTNVTVRTLDKLYEECFAKHLVTYADRIDAAIDEENKLLRYSKGQKARLELKQQFKSELIYSCDVYFNTIEDTRQLLLQKANEKALDSTQLSQLNQQVAMNPHWLSYLERSQFYFRVGNLQEAKTDVLKSIEVCPAEDNLTLRKPKLLLAWILEEQNSYSQAIAIYDEVSRGEFDTEVGILRAIVDRKSGSGNRGYSRGSREAARKKRQATTTSTNTTNNSTASRRRTDRSQSSEDKDSTNNRGETPKSEKSLRGLFNLD